MGFSKQGKKAGWPTSSNCVQNAFFRLSPSGRNETTPLGSIPLGQFHTTILSGLFQAEQKAGLTNVVQLRSKRVFSTFPIGAKRNNTLGIDSTRSVSYHHFEWAFPSRAKSRVDERRPIAFKTRFFDFPHRGETKQHPWVRIPRGRFHTTIFAGLYQAAENAGLTKVVQLRSKLVLSSFPIGAKRKNTLGFEFHEVAFIPPFCWALPSSGKRRVDEGRPVAFKTRLVEFPHRCETKKHPWDRIPRGRFHTTILGGIYQGAENAGLTKVVQLRWKLVFSSFPIWANRKNTLWIEFHEVGFTPPFSVGFSQQRKKPGWRRSSNCVQNSFFRLFPSGRNEKTPLGSNSMRSVSYHHFCWAFASSAKRRVDECRPIALKTRFFEFPHRGESKKHPLDRIPRGRLHTTILGGLFPAAQNAGLTKVVQLRSKLVFSTIPIGAKRKNTLGIEFHEVGFIPPFWGEFTK